MAGETNVADSPINEPKHDRGTSGEQQGLSDKRGVSTSGSVVNRGTLNMAMPAVVNRLTRYALRYYAERRAKKLRAPERFTESEFHLLFRTEDTDREAQWFLKINKFNEYFFCIYKDDEDTFARVIKRTALDNLSHELRQNELLAKKMQDAALVNDTLYGIHHASRAYFDILDKIKNTSSTTRTGGIAEGRDSIIEAPHIAIQQVDNAWLSVLFSADPSLLGSLAESEPVAREALQNLFARAIDDISSFRKALFGDDPYREPSPIWRYPPIVLRAVSQFSDSPHLQAFVVDQIASSRAQGIMDRPEVQVGLLLLGLTGLLVTTGPIGALLAVTDLGASAIFTFNAYMGERQNNLAIGASVIGQGNIFTDKPSDYLGVAGGLALTLLSGFFLLKQFSRVQGKAHPVEAREKTPHEPAPVEQHKTKDVNVHESQASELVSNEARGTRGRTTSDIEPSTSPKSDKPETERGVKGERGTEASRVGQAENNLPTTPSLRRASPLAARTKSTLSSKGFGDVEIIQIEDFMMRNPRVKFIVKLMGEKDAGRINRFRNFIPHMKVQGSENIVSDFFSVKSSSSRKGADGVMRFVEERLLGERIVGFGIPKGKRITKNRISWEQKARDVDVLISKPDGDIWIEVKSWTEKTLSAKVNELTWALLRDAHMNPGKHRLALNLHPVISIGQKAPTETQYFNLLRRVFRGTDNAEQKVLSRLLREKLKVSDALLDKHGQLEELLRQFVIFF